MHTPRRLMKPVAFAAAIFVAFAARSAVAQITISLGNAGFESAISAGLPTTAGVWAGDLNYVVTTQNGVTPYAGAQMLHLKNMAPDGIDVGTGSDTVQLVDMSPYAASIGAGNFTVTLSAYFNRSDFTYSQFQVFLRSYSGSVANFPSDINSYTAIQTGNLFADSDINTWELGTVSLTLPTNTTYLAAWVSVQSPGNVVSVPDGYFADSVALTAVPEPSTCAALAGVAALGLAVWRHRRRAKAA